MNLIEFISKFPTNESCEIHYANLRLERGIACKKCEKQTPHYFLASVKKFQCKCCRSRNTRVAERIEGLRLKYKELIPEELETRFILEGRVKKDTTIDDLTITPMENVSEELWDKLQFILP